MPHDSDQGVRIQRRYYTQTAAQYEVMHAHESDDDCANLKFIDALLRMIEPHTLLDVGAGTGRGIRHFLDAMPDLVVNGIEPVSALIGQAIQNGGIPPGLMIQGVGEALPFRNASFDVVCSLGILHHVPAPDAVVREMLRVARKAVIISDGNRFGQGPWPVRVLKLALYKAGLWGMVDYLRTRGRGYMLTAGDGVSYSYSVYDSLDCISEWAAQLILAPAESCKATSWFHPLLTSGGVIVCAIKDLDPVP
jgi:ubiquinone/menaquinone biosynthesis C-methylase UbiE